MAQGDKSSYYRAIKAAGYTFDKHYRDYTANELKAIWANISDEPIVTEKTPIPEATQGAGSAARETDEIADLRTKFDQLASLVGSLADAVTKNHAVKEPAPQATQQFEAASEEHAGLTQNVRGGSHVIKIDPDGTRWFQMEVQKPSYPKPRGRRVLRFTDSGVQKETIKVGEYTETFEIPGDPANAKINEVKVTLPSYQTGIFLSPNMPFKIHTYRGVRGFDLFDVQNYYGGPDLVPSTIKRCYISNDLCYDIQTTVRAIENEYRERVLQVEKGLSA